MDTNTNQEVKKFNSKKVFATIGIVLIVIILVAAGIWYFVQNAENKVPVDNTPIKTASSSAQPKSASVSALDKTLGWQTYKNTIVGFTIKYPLKWVSETIGTNPSCTDDQAFFAPDGVTLGRCSSGFGGIINISRTQEGDNLTKQAAAYIEADYKDLVKTMTFVAGKKAEKITGVSKISNDMLDQTGYTVIVYIVDLGTRALVIGYIQSPKWADNSANFETMVSSLTFL